MGKKASAPLTLGGVEDLEEYLHCNHAAYMRHGNKVYYLTDVGESYWRAQDTCRRNQKNHFVDCSAIVPTLGEFMSLRFIDGMTIGEAFDHSTFYASLSGEKDA